MAETFPEQGRPAADVLAEIRDHRGDDANWRGGRTFSLVYNPADPELEALQEAVAQEYLHEDYLNPFAFPSLLRMEQEVVDMAIALFGADEAAGKLTSGGTESIFLAVQVAREHARARGIDACLGGWLLPFWEDLGEPVPPWTLAVPGVTSMEARYGGVAD